MPAKTPRTPQAWEQISTKLLQRTIVFDLHVQRLRSPRNGVEDDFYYIETVDWVNVIPITEAGEVVLVNQYRFGTHSPSLELPGGMLSSNDEDPKEAALREMVEETGYGADDAESLGFAHPNPAIQTNRCHFYVARGVKPVQKPELDLLEDIVVEVVPLAKVRELIEQHRITHALMVAAFMRFFAKEDPKLFERASR